MTTSDDKRFGDDNRGLEANIFKNQIDFSKKWDLMEGSPGGPAEAARPSWEGFRGGRAPQNLPTLKAVPYVI